MNGTGFSPNIDHPPHYGALAPEGIPMLAEVALIG